MASIYGKPTIDDLAAQVADPDLNTIIRRGPAAVNDGARDLAHLMLKAGYDSHEAKDAAMVYTKKYAGLVKQANDKRVNNYIETMKGRQANTEKRQSAEPEDNMYMSPFRRKDTK